MAFSLGGLASGIDTNALVDGLMAVAKQPSDQLAARKTQVDAASTTISTFSSKLAALKTAALARRAWRFAFCGSRFATVSSG